MLYRNSTGAECREGTDSGRGILYCGRRFTAKGECPCGTCDGVCGPNNGCACPACWALLSGLVSPQRCKNGHELVRVVAKSLRVNPGYSKGFRCDVCNQLVTKGWAPVLHCAQDNYDICAVCAFKCIAPVQRAPPPPPPPAPASTRPPPTGVLGEKVVKSALVIIPPQELWGPIQELRKRYDKAYDRWMPHINILYPFVPEAAFEQARARIAAALEKVPRFHVTLADLGYFDFGRSCTLWARPVASPSDSLARLHALLLSLFPQCTETSEKGGFSPHLTLGQFPGKSATEEMIVRTDWNPIEFDIEGIQLISRTAEDPFTVKFTVPLRADEDEGTAASDFEFVEWNGRNPEGQTLYLRMQIVEGRIMGTGRLEGDEFAIIQGIATQDGSSGSITFKASFNADLTHEFNGVLKGNALQGTLGSFAEFNLTRDPDAWSATAAVAAAPRPKVVDIVAVDPDAEDKSCVRVERWIGSNHGPLKSLPKARSKLCAAIAPLCKTTYTVNVAVVLKHLEACGLVVLRGNQVELRNSKPVDPANIPAPPPTNFPEILEDVLARARAWCISQKSPPRTREGLTHGLMQLCRVKQSLSPDTIVDTLVRRGVLTFDLDGTVHYYC